MKSALKIKTQTRLFLLVVLAASSGSAAAPEDNPYEWKHRTHSVAVFKNGMGFFMREGQTQLRDGWCVAEEVPPAAFGTFAVYSHDEGNVVDIVGYGPGETVDLEETPDADLEAAVSKLLNERLQLRVEISYRSEGLDQAAIGRLVEVGDKYAILQDEKNNYAVPIASVRKIRLLDNPMRVHVVDAEEKPVDSSRVGMMYMRRGITWIPDYTLEVVDEDTAKLTLRGTLINEAEDLIDCDVHFVVGVPNFAHADHMAPIALGQAMRSAAISAVSNPILSQQIANNIQFYNNGSVNMGSAVSEFPVDSGLPSGGLDQTISSLPRMDNASAADFTVYTKENLTVRQGEKAIVTLMTVEVDYSHRYRWTVGQQMKHYFVLRNDTPTAWTTGPCLGIEGRQPLTEDLLKYTPKGSFAELPVTSAINISYNNSEEELERALKEYNPYGQENREYYKNFYDLVTLGGAIDLKNYADHTAEIVITAPVTGRPLDASNMGKLRTDTRELQLLKRTGSVVWTMNLEPEATMNLTYQYERYVKSQ